jgi:vacuolar-type H+-ATPase catalytic subunit A/Vma1
MNTEITDLINERNKFYGMIKINDKRSCKNAAYTCYKNLNNTVKKKINIAKKSHFEKNLNECDSNKSRWNCVHSLGVTQKAKKLSDVHTSSDISANSFNKFFLRNNVAEKIDCSMDLPKHKTIFRFEDVNEDDMIKAIYHIKSNAAGPAATH